MDLSEKETRERHIDPLLKEEGWLDKYVKKEVNSVSSKFKVGKFEYYFKDASGRFMDYLLVWEDNTPLAVIEAKRFSLDAEKGVIQATTYQKDVEAQTGYPIPIFLTNGKKWYIKEKDYGLREVAGPFSQKDLKRKYDLYKNKKDLLKLEVNTNIVDRSKGIEVTRRTLEHFSLGHRKALINMATGTGKTRVAVAIIESLIRAKRVQNVLFVVDRISLGRNAFYKGFQKFLHSEPACLLNEQEFSKDKRIYVSTVQTLMAKSPEGGFYFQKFGPGFFDLIVFDEAHRSYYDRQNLVMKYFDSLNIGLTATPSKSEAKNTYDLFECERGKPTVEYSYDEAVKDAVLVPYDAQVIETKVLGLGIRGMDLDKELKTNLIKQDEDPEHFEIPGTKFVKHFTDEKTNSLIVTEFMNRCYKSDDGKPCKTIFFCINVKHAEALRGTFKRLYPNVEAKDVEVIVSRYDRYMDAVERFQKESRSIH
jgi:type I restriction enzyme R subunit